MKILIIDITAGFLSRAWETGSYLGNFDLVIRADSWDDVYRVLENLDVPPGTIFQIQFWGHGQQGKPLINKLPVDIVEFSGSLRDQNSRNKLAPDAIIWWRACDVAEGQRGHDFMLRCVDWLNCSVVAHCEVISLPNPLWQKQICGLRPGQRIWWSLSGDELPGCSTLRMNPPSWAFKD